MSAIKPYVNKGDYASEEEALSAAVRALVANFDPAEIWLFGSRASSHPRPDADFDLLLVHRPDYLDVDDFAAPHIAVAALKLAADVVPCSYENFKEAHKRRAGLVPHILATGRPIYRRPK
jgi:predicted nucleotidyltransferase